MQRLATLINAANLPLAAHPNKCTKTNSKTHSAKYFNQLARMEKVHTHSLRKMMPPKPCWQNPLKGTPQQNFINKAQ
ncbi:hypothetical protein [Aeromonas fluvialis]|uniref:hypothetical protein n=1 Tax=Aeromonas fluvialis TaxID=591962 RepID=UPI0012ED8310|nr:hypothetical protein [Aeromonas fluvialis]